MHHDFLIIIWTQAAHRLYKAQHETISFLIFKGTGLNFRIVLKLNVKNLTLIGNPLSREFANHKMHS